MSYYVNLILLFIHLLTLQHPTSEQPGNNALIYQASGNTFELQDMDIPSQFSDVDNPERYGVMSTNGNNDNDVFPVSKKRSGLVKIH